MQAFSSKTFLSGSGRFALAAVALSALAIGAGMRAAADEPPVYTLEVSDVAAKVGENTVLLARLKLHEGYRILHAYNNRGGQFSSLDDSVAFERRSVPGTDEDGTLVFAISVRPTSPGSHPINGVLRFGYLHGDDTMAMISVPLMANVVGTN